MKKLLFLTVPIAIVSAFLIFTSVSQASAPNLKLSTTSTSGNVQLVVSGALANNNVLLYYHQTDGSSHLQYLGKTDSAGAYTVIIKAGEYNITPSDSVHVIINKQSSNSVTWPISTSSNGAIALSPTSVVLKVGQSTNLTVSNTGNKILYLLNNSNPQIANINILGQQITVLANSFGQTVATVCILGTTSNCASTYITIQNSGAQVLTFSQSNLTVAAGQHSLVSILNAQSTANYSILNNSNPRVISASLQGTVIDLKALANNGSASLTVCSADLSSCGIINAQVGNISSTALTFSQTNPNFLIGQSVNISLNGGSSYNVSTNSNSAVVQASITNSNQLTLVGQGTGSATITVCASNGNCGSLTATVSYATSGPITLSQNNLWLRAGQAISITVSGGSRPYSLSNASTKAQTIFQTNLQNNILTINGIKAGSGTIDVCSAGGACTQLAVLVNGLSSNKQLSFSNNNLKLKVGSSAQVSIYGNGGYYLSSSNGQDVASIKLTGAKLDISAQKAGTANALICQSGGQCQTLYLTVSANNSSNQPLSFSQNNPIISVGQNLSITLSGGLSSNYYLSANSNPTIVKAQVSSSQLSLSGKTTGSAVLTICSATNSCASLAVKINSSSNQSATKSSSNSQQSVKNQAQAMLVAIAHQSQLISSSNLNSILSAVQTPRSSAQEQLTDQKYLAKYLKNTSLTNTDKDNLTYFITYGTKDALKLGAGERAGVIGSYLEAYGHLPTTTANWSDVLKIANGRWPGATSPQAISEAKSEFIKVYNRPADMNNSHDANAITLIAYGLRPLKRNLHSEEQAIRTFKSVYEHAPVNSLAWNIVRAIAYSGASR